MSRLRSWWSVLDLLGRVLKWSPEEWPAPTKGGLLVDVGGGGGEGERGRGGEGERGRGEAGDMTYVD